MNRIFMIISVTLLATNCLAGQTPSEHIYKGKQPLPNDLFDNTMDCGLNLDRLERCIREDRSSDKGESFCNDVKLFAGNKKKMLEKSKAIKKQPAQKELNMAFMEELNTIQSKYTKQFIDAGLTAKQIDRIPPINNFKCKKVSTNPLRRYLSKNYLPGTSKK
jgi:hypothetical protein